MPRNRASPACRAASRSSTSSPRPTSRRASARSRGRSGCRGRTKIDLKRLLKDMADEGLIDSSPGRAFHQSGGVPKVTVLRVAQVDDSGTCLRGARAMACGNASAAASADRARQAERARDRRPGARRTEEQRRGLHRPPDEEARALGRAGAGRRQTGRRPLLAVAGRQARAARAVHQRPQGCRGGRPRAVRSHRPAAAGQRAGRRGARRSLRAAQLQPHRDPQAWAPARIRAGGDRRGASRVEAAARRARGPDPSADRRDRPRRRARP